MVKNIQERQKKHRSDSNVSSLSLDVSREEDKAEKDYRDDISIDSTLESEESECDSSDSELHDSPNTHPVDLTDSMDLIDSTEDTLPLPYAEVYIRYKSLLKRACASASGSLGLLNIFQSPFGTKCTRLPTPSLTTTIRSTRRPSKFSSSSLRGLVCLPGHHGPLQTNWYGIGGIRTTK